MKLFVLLSLISLPTLGQVSRTYEQFVPVGMTGEFIGASCPNGWLRTDGRSVSRAQYPKLFAYVGTVHGNGSTGVSGSTGCPHASNCFNLPDTRGRFIRDLDGGANRGGATNVGTVQGDLTKRPDTPFSGATASDGNHYHFTASNASNGQHTLTSNLSSSTPIAVLAPGGSHYESYILQAGSGTANVGRTNTDGAHTHTVSISGGGDNETRPKNIGLLKCVKF